jgi:hypothetical protein
MSYVFAENPIEDGQDAKAPRAIRAKWNKNLLPNRSYKAYFQAIGLIRPKKQKSIIPF